MRFVTKLKKVYLHDPVSTLPFGVLLSCATASIQH
jgi:hypothetical protein